MVTKKFFRKPFFWLLFALISALCAVIAVKVSPQAFPIVHINLTMDKHEALKKANSLSERLHLGPKDHEQAVLFISDDFFNAYVELEGGGKKELFKIIDNGLYEPYTWNVRHYAFPDVHELLVRFTPDGQPYGFIETLAEDAVASNLSAKDAQAVAEKTAAEAWGLSINDYDLIESAKFENPNKRVDHSFVYERKALAVGKAHFRVRLMVSGDRLTRLMPYVQVPEDFDRRYQEMRSLNERLAFASEMAVLLLYMLGAGLFSLYFFIKQRFILWRWPLLWGILVALLNLLSSINNFPHQWMSYNTAIEPSSFSANLLISAIFEFFFYVAFLTILFAAAEAITRKAFPHQLQLTKVWQKKVAASHLVFGATLTGYLLVPVLIAFQAIFYIITARYFQWWIPSEALVNPNILGTYAPWLEPVARALTAGSMEECLFRALPLGGAALLGQRFGHKKLFIALALIIQAFIFGAAHANYPMQPFYARMVELFLPSLIFGGLYLAFGLFPAIINHFIFDLVLMSFPIFVSSGAAIYLSEAMVIILGLIPIFVIIYARLKEKHFTDLKSSDYNYSFVSLVPVKERAPLRAPLTLKRPKIVLASLVLGVIGLCSLVFFAHGKGDEQQMTLSREDAIKKAQNFLQKHHYHIDESWSFIANAYNKSDSLATKFIWQEGGPELYKNFLGSYLAPLHWQVRVVKFSGPVEARAEEFVMSVNAYSQIYEFNHKLAEASEGANLSEEKARFKAESDLETLGEDAHELLEISAVASRLPNRTDWDFSWSDPLIYPLDKGRAEIVVGLAGDEFAHFSRGIHVPEEWLRNEEKKGQKSELLGIILATPFLTVLLLALIAAFMRFIADAQCKKVAGLCFAAFFTLLIVNMLNRVPAMMPSLSTTKSQNEQIIMALIGSSLMSIVGALTISLIFAYIFTLADRQPQAHSKEVLCAVFLGLFLAGAENVVFDLIPPNFPITASIDALNSYSPLLRTIFSAGAPYLAFCVFFLLLALFFERRMHERRYSILAPLAFFLSAFIITSPLVGDLPIYLATSLVRGLVLALAWHWLFRYQVALVPLCLVGYFIPVLIKQGVIDSYPHSLLNALVAAGVLALAAVGIFFVLNAQKKGL